MLKFGVFDEFHVCCYMLRSDDKEWISPRTKYEAFVFVTWKIRRKLFSANPLSEAMPSEAIENKVHSVIVIEHLVPVAGTIRIQP